MQFSDQTKMLSNCLRLNIMQTEGRSQTKDKHFLEKQMFTLTGQIHLAFLYMVLLQLTDSTIFNIILNITTFWPLR